MSIQTSSVVSAGGVAVTACSYQPTGTSTAARRPWRVRATCCPCHCTRLIRSANWRRASSALTSAAILADRTHLIVCTERTDRKAAYLAHDETSPADPQSTPESRSREFWAWFSGQHAGSRRKRTAELPPAEFARRPSSRNLLAAITGSGQRRPPSSEIRQRILSRQKNRCLYCENTIGSQVRRGSRTVILQLNWDHFVPYAYGRTNPDANWVAACHVCNNIKSSRMFETVARARLFIVERWQAKGYAINPVLTQAQIVHATSPREVRPGKIPLDLAEEAERISTGMKSLSKPASTRRIVQGVYDVRSQDTAIPPALAALVKAGFVEMLTTAHKPLFWLRAPYAAPPDSPRATTKPQPPLLVRCPVCRASSRARCRNRYGAEMTGFHVDRLRFAEGPR